MYQLSTKILIVDDLVMMRKLVIKSLAAMGYSHFEEADDGKQAWEKIKNTPDIGLIISDWHMPHCTGFNLLRQVRANQQFKNTPFILLTTESEYAKVKSAIEAGADSCIPKPFTSDSLKHNINLIYQRKSA